MVRKYKGRSNLAVNKVSIDGKLITEVNGSRVCGKCLLLLLASVATLFTYHTGKGSNMVKRGTNGVEPVMLPRSTVLLKPFPAKMYNVEPTTARSWHTEDPGNAVRL